jgi:hypothetical protein
MSRARVEIINEEVKNRNFEDLDAGTIFEYDGNLYLKLNYGKKAVLLSNNELLVCIAEFDYDDPVIVYDNTVITVRIRAK